MAQVEPIQAGDLTEAADFLARFPGVIHTPAEWETRLRSWWDHLWRLRSAVGSCAKARQSLEYLAAGIFKKLGATPYCWGGVSGGDPRRGCETDGFQPDGTFRYAGEGQVGDMQMKGGNRAILAS